MNGFGAAGFMGGLAQGMNTGSKLVDAYYKGQANKQKADIKNALAGGIDSAKAARQAEIDGKVEVGGTANADDTATVPTFKVDGNEYGDEKSARGAAEGAVGSVMDFFYQNEAPKIADLYLQQGDIEKAEKWNTWIKDKNVTKGFEAGVRAYQAAAQGDDEGAMKNLFKMYNQKGYFEDGRKAKSWEPIKNKAGEVTGYAITLTGSDGKDRVANVNKGEELLSQVQMLANPQTAYESSMASYQKAREEKLNMAKDELKHARSLEVAGVKASNTVALENVRQGNRLERDGIQAQRQQAQPTAVEQKAAGLSKVGASLGMEGEALKQFVAAGVGAKSDDDFVKMATGLLSKQQDLYGNNKFLNLPPAEQQQQIQQLASTIKAARGAQQQPMAGGIPAPGQGGAPKGATIIDTKTGKVVPYP